MSAAANYSVLAGAEGGGVSLEAQGREVSSSGRQAQPIRGLVPGHLVPYPRHTGTPRLKRHMHPIISRQPWFILIVMVSLQANIQMNCKKPPAAQWGSPMLSHNTEAWRASTLA